MVKSHIFSAWFLLFAFLLPASGPQIISFCILSSLYIVICRKASLIKLLHIHRNIPSAYSEIESATRVNILWVKWYSVSTENPAKAPPLLPMSSSLPIRLWLPWFFSLSIHLSNLIPSLPPPCWPTIFLLQGCHPAILAAWNGSPDPVGNSFNLLKSYSLKVISLPSFFFFDGIITI